MIRKLGDLVLYREFVKACVYNGDNKIKNHCTGCFFDGERRCERSLLCGKHGFNDFDFRCLFFGNKAAIYYRWIKLEKYD